MKRKSHHIIPLFLLLLTLAPTLFMGGLQAFQLYIRHRMQSSLEKGTLITISMPAAEVQWYEQDREVMVQGRMFDIKSYQISNGIFTAQGIFDDEETKVMHLMKGHWSERKQQQVVIQLLLLSHCVLLLYFLFYSFSLPFFAGRLHTLFTILYAAPFLAIFSPPPKPPLFF